MEHRFLASNRLSQMGDEGPDPQFSELRYHASCNFHLPNDAIIFAAKWWADHIRNKLILHEIPDRVDTVTQLEYSSAMIDIKNAEFNTQINILESLISRAIITEYGTCGLCEISIEYDAQGVLKNELLSNFKDSRTITMIIADNRYADSLKFVPRLGTNYSMYVSQFPLGKDFPSEARISSFMTGPNLTN